jgi:hypothetical protein
MEQYVGLDVSQEQTSVCVVDGGGKVIWEGKCTSTPEAIAATIRMRAPEAARIGLESGPLSAWHWHELRKLGLPVVCLDARHKAALAHLRSQPPAWRRSMDLGFVEVSGPEACCEPSQPCIERLKIGLGSVVPPANELDDQLGKLAIVGIRYLVRVLGQQLVGRPGE